MTGTQPKEQGPALEKSQREGTDLPEVCLAWYNHKSSLLARDIHREGGFQCDCVVLSPCPSCWRR